MIVLISGRQGSGKTTLSTGLVKKLPQYQMIKFADPIYKVHNKMWDILADEYGITREAKSGDFLQYFGSEFGRKRDKDIWVKCALNRIKIENIENVILDDTRFTNEVDAFPDALTIRLECDRDMRKSRADSWRDNELHQSETGLNEYAKNGNFHIYIDSGKRSADEVLEIAYNAIMDQFIPKDLMLAGGRISDDYYDLVNSIYKHWDCDLKT